MNHEINLTVYDREVGRRLEEMFVEDLARSRSYTRAQRLSRPLEATAHRTFRGELQDPGG